MCTWNSARKREGERLEHKNPETTWRAPPGTMPSSTAAKVAFLASSTRSLRSSSSASVAAPTCRRGDGATLQWFILVFGGPPGQKTGVRVSNVTLITAVLVGFLGGTEVRSG